MAVKLSTIESISRPETSPPIPDETLVVELELLELEVKELNDVIHYHLL